MTFTAIVLIFSPPAAWAECTRTPIIFNFGDSNSDTGGYDAAYGSSFSSPNGHTYFHETSYRRCDGRLIIDFLCESVKANYLPSYMECLTSSFVNGVNFAIAGSTVVSKHVLFILSTQVFQFTRFRILSVQSKETKGVLREVGVFKEVDFIEALYMIDIGQNDLYGAFKDEHLTVPEVIAKIPSIINEIKTAINSIYKLGGRNFWVHNTGPLGCLPERLARVGEMSVSADYDQTGCLIPLNEAAKEFNTKLRELCEEMRFLLNNSVIVYVDMYTIKYNLISNPAIYGFENPLMPCCGGGGPPYNATIGCGEAGFSRCEPGKRYISWDGIHYTEGANRVFALQVASANFSTPPIKFDYFCSNST
nr:GDSL esterase/lipase LIP-4-like [Ipomoea trifida]